MKNRILRAVAGVAIAAAALTATAASAGEHHGHAKGTAVGPVNVTGTVRIADDYVYRGFSKNGGDLAVSGTLKATHDSGAFGGVTVNSIDFGITNASTEAVAFGGYNTMIGDLSVRGGASYWMYPDASDRLDLDYAELNAGLGYNFGPGGVTFDAFWSPDYFGGTGDSWYFEAGAKIGLGLPGLCAHGWGGFQTVDDLPTDIWNYGLGLNYDAGFASFGVDWTVTDAENVDDDNDGRFTFSVSRSF